MSVFNTLGATCTCSQEGFFAHILLYCTCADGLIYTLGTHCKARAHCRL